MSFKERALTGLFGEKANRKRTAKQYALTYGTFLLGSFAITGDFTKAAIWGTGATVVTIGGSLLLRPSPSDSG